MRGLEFSLWRIRDLLSTRAYLTITEALAAILLIAPELTGGDGFCGSLCKFAWVTCDQWLRWEILAIQTIKIRSEIRERERERGGEGETTDCEAGTYFTHSVVICQALAPNYSDYSEVLSISGDAGWCWYKPWLWLTSVTAHQRPGRAGRAGVRARPRFLNQRVVFSRLPRELGTTDTGDFRDMSHNVTKTSSGMLTGNENPDLLMTKLWQCMKVNGKWGDL